ncbi:hypothetical protein BV898_01781 [Hypsibius exemplaris]|uniref:Uncharacterized protein n=1 Tax=Hypsibius exemplaris TaxID=2072580 RepID=A0A1W0XA05_HYPEX|nr:hypothetical protein BV898_01781 [Hypsibius exemplaris]
MASSSPEVVIFDDPDKRARERLGRIKAKKRGATAAARAADSQATSTNKAGGLISVKLRKTDYHDMLRYGISNLKGEERKQARMRLAIELGAKPPKKGTGNFKNFLAQMKSEKDEKRQSADERSAIQQAIAKSNFGKPKGGRKKKFQGGGFKKRGKNEVSGAFDGQIGSYKRGVQTVSKRDVAGGTRPSHDRKRSK